jgi:hypothetical protein
MLKVWIKKLQLHLVTVIILNFIKHLNVESTIRPDIRYLASPDVRNQAKAVSGASLLILPLNTDK